MVGLKGEPGDLFVGDRKYGTRANLVAMDGLQAATLCRFSPQQCQLEHADGSQMTVVSWLQSQPEDHDLFETEGYVSYDQQRVSVRVLAWRLPPEAATQARQRVLARARRRGQKVRPQTLVLAGWVLLVSTLAPRTWPARELFWLYRHRWQIELLFKRMKQFLLLVQLRSHQPDTVRATLLAALVAWTLIEEEGQALLRALEEGQGTGQPGLLQAYLPLLEQWEEEDIDTRTAPTPRPSISAWGVMSCCTTRWRAIVLGQWSRERVIACLPRLTRYFCPSPRRRLNQRLVFQAWAQQHLLAGAFIGGL
jgi:hypothetical protein